MGWLVREAYSGGVAIKPQICLLPEATPGDAVKLLLDAADRAGPNRERVRQALMAVIHDSPSEKRD